MLATHHSHLNMSKDPKTEMTMKVMRVGIRGQGLEMQTRLKPQVSFFYYFIHFLNYTNVLQVPQWRTATMMLAIHHSHLDVHWSCWALHLQHVHWWRRPGGKWIGRMQWNTMVKRREVLGLLQWILGCADVWAQLPQWDCSSHHWIERWSWKTKSSIC